MKYRVTTHHSTYLFDADKKTAVREPQADDATSFDNDGEEIPYDFVDIAIGQPLIIIWRGKNSEKQWRVTTPIVSVEDVYDEEGT